MGNSASITGGIEVPVSDEHPWGVNSGIRMPIPLNFANKIRKLDSPENIEYRKFLGYKLYHLVPLFINSSDSFNTKYNEFVESIFGDSIQILDNISVAQIHKSMVRYLEDLKLREIYVRESNTEQLETFTELWSLYNELIPLYARFPEYFVSFKNSLAKRINTMPFNDDFCYDDDKSFLRFMLQNGAILQGKDLSESVILDHYALTESNNRRILSNVNTKYKFTIMPVSMRKWDGGHAITIVADHTKKILYIMDSNGTENNLIGLSVFVKGKCNILKDYTEQLLIPIKYGLSFQGISQDAFCQTWTIFVSLLTVLNSKNIQADYSNDIVYSEIIKYAKPLVGPKDANPGTRLGLIIIEFMYFLYHFYRDEISEFILIMTKKDPLHLTHSEKESLWQILGETGTYAEYQSIKKEMLEMRVKMNSEIVSNFEKHISTYRTSVQPELIRQTVGMNLPPRNLREVAKAIRDRTL